MGVAIFRDVHLSYSEGGVPVLLEIGSCSRSSDSRSVLIQRILYPLLTPNSRLGDAS